MMEQEGSPMNRAWLAAIAVSLFPACAIAQMYKCVDERGVTHYSDKPSPGCKGSEVDIRASPPMSGASPRSAQDLKQQETDFQRRRIAREREEEKAAAQRAALERRCAAMQTELQRLGTPRRLVSVDAKGERTEVDETTRNARMVSLKAEIDRQCR
jgi:phage protein D